MLISTLLSALPLLTPALPQEPVAPPVASRKVEKQEPAKKAKSKKKASKNAKAKSTAKKNGKKKSSAKPKSNGKKNKKAKKAKQSKFAPKAKVKAKAKPQSMKSIRRQAQAAHRQLNSSSNSSVRTLADVNVGNPYAGGPVLTVDQNGNIALDPNPVRPVQPVQWGTVSLQPHLLDLVNVSTPEQNDDQVKNIKKQARKKLRKQSSGN